MKLVFFFGGGGVFVRQSLITVAVVERLIILAVWASL